MPRPLVGGQGAALALEAGPVLAAGARRGALLRRRTPAAPLRVARPSVVPNRPAWAVRGVLDHHTGLLELVTHGVGGRPVLAGTSLRPLVERQRDQRVDHGLEVAATVARHATGRRAGRDRARRASPGRSPAPLAASRRRRRPARCCPPASRRARSASAAEVFRSSSIAATNSAAQRARHDRRRPARPRARRSPRSAGTPPRPRAAPRRSSRSASGSAARPCSSAARPGVTPSASTGVEVDDVAQRLAHLGLAEVEQAVVHPVPGERQPGRAGLGDLVLVVREDQVEPAAVDVELGAQVAPGTSPSTRCASRAGRDPTARASTRRPARQAWRPSTARSRGDRAWPAPGRPRPPASRRAAARTARRSRRTTARRSRRRRSRRSPGRRGRRRSASGSARASPGCDRSPAARTSAPAPRARRTRRRGCARWRTRSTRTAGPARRAFARILSSMSVMLRMKRHVIAAVPEPARQHVVVDAGPEVADVRAGLHREPTQVDPDLAGFPRDEVPHRAGRGVIQAQRHPERVAAACGAAGRTLGV